MTRSGRSTMHYKAWEVWLAYVKYEDKPVAKKRPVLIVPDSNGSLMMVKMTKHEPRNDFEYEVVKWHTAGLTTKTTIRTGKNLKISDTTLIHRLGNLDPVDVVKFRDKLSAYIRQSKEH